MKVAAAASAVAATFIVLASDLSVLVGIWPMVPVLGIASALTLEGDELTVRQKWVCAALVLGIASLTWQVGEATPTP